MKRYDGTMSDWRDEMGLTQRKTKEMWELDGYCDRCIKPILSMSQSERRKHTNHPVKYWEDLYMGWMDNDVAVRQAFGYTIFIDAVKEGYLIDNPESPYACARQYRQSEGVLRAIYGYFGITGLQEAIDKLQSHPIFNPNDHYWSDLERRR